MAVRVKICGITRLQDLHAACDAGADAVGFVFYEKSPRHLAIDSAAMLVRALPPFVQSVGLFVNAEPAFIERVLHAVPLDLLQFHGDETPADCMRYGRPWIKAVRVNRDTDLLECAADFEAARGLLLDAYVAGVPGGTGERFDWSLIPPRLSRPIVLSGGLTPDNVAEAVRRVRPWAVDVSSGVEAEKGIKDAHKIARFIAKAKEAS
ncbi:phosphoribosylanthranilate isomerase [Thiobacillus sp. 65-1402]|uniref:phosphoribosylanthranilate isomerase n=1 Tax=Thiobacillus sp. 65-1402 TaxID=1895861 RepID=UPI00095A3C51|nr:phosphoribosylanthranilate isomerase [Thiobacillus sp. 65-1402]OJW97887.1 MAG: N-(5'-phosphoribosyl)anthranilate isomerase [Thiobacillus sp. 65-1402]